MTTTVNREGDHLSAANPSRWVTRKHGKIMSWHTKSIHAVRWMRDNADSIEGWSVTKSYIVRAGYWDRSRDPKRAIAFEPEMYVEVPTFPEAMDALAGWLHAMWEQDRSNHPSPAGRHQAWARWNDVIALANIASLTILPNPAFAYAFGPLSPPEGKGHDLRISVAPTADDTLIRMVERNRNA
jgi:hypothetical protein